MKAIAIIIATLISFVSITNAQDKALSGSWTKKSQAIKGTWSIQTGKVELKKFSTKKAPDLKIAFSPKKVAELNNKNALEGAIIVSPLKSHKGDQVYTLPEGIDITKYQSIIIHCKKYTKLWGASNIR